MPSYRYVGAASAAILDSPFEFKKYGQLVELPDDMVNKAIVEGKISLIPAEEFDILGHDPKELQYHSRFETHATVHPKFPDFHLKRGHAWAKVHEHREALTKALHEQEAIAAAPVEEAVNAEHE